VGAQRNQEPVSALLAKREKKDNKYVVATKVSFVAPIGPFFDRLDTFSIARLLKITLVLLFSGEIHYLPSLRASLGRELTQRRFSFAQIRSFLMQNSDPRLRRRLRGGSGRRSANELKHWTRRSSSQCFLFNIGGNAFADTRATDQCSHSNNVFTRSGCRGLVDRFLHQNLIDLDRN
jgi:hypothetical protein